MSKYIDADKLIKFKEALADIIVSSQGVCTYQDCKDIAEREALLLIATLQQEQPEFSNGKFVFPKYLYARTKDNKTIDMSYAPQDMTAVEYIRNDFVEQEQPEVDLEEEIDKMWNPRFNLGWDDNSLLSINHKSFEAIARHFYDLGLNARNEGLGVELIAAERKRQIEVEGWTKEHDATHTNNELAKAAICYADPNVHYYQENRFLRRRIPNTNFWPIQWDKCWFKPSNDRIRDLVKAGALIAAEIDRLNARKEESK